MDAESSFGSGDFLCQHHKSINSHVVAGEMSSIFLGVFTEQTAQVAVFVLEKRSLLTFQKFISKLKRHFPVVSSSGGFPEKNCIFQSHANGKCCVGCVRSDPQLFEFSIGRIAHQIEVLFRLCQNFLCQLFIGIFRRKIEISSCRSHAPMAVLYVRMADISSFGNVNNTFISGVWNVVCPEIVHFDEVSAAENSLKFLVGIVQRIK